MSKDPRFNEMPKKDKRMKIDKKRLNELFENKKAKDFNLISKFDKTGKVNKEHDKVLNQFYEIEEDQTKSKFYD